MAKKIEESGRKKADEQRKSPGLSGSMRADRRTVQALPLSELIAKVSKEFELNESQAGAVESATGKIANGFVTGDIYKVFKSPELNISYFDDFNLDIYYGVNMNWKITKKFVLNTTLRFNNTYDKVDLGFKKSNPILFMIGTSF